MQLNLATGAYNDIDVDINNQKCVNFYSAPAGPFGRGAPNENNIPSVLRLTAGVKSILNLGVRGIRSQIYVRNYLYVTTNDTIYKLSIDTVNLTASIVSSHTIADLTTYVDVAYNDSQIMWVDGTNGYIYNDQTATYSQIVDADFPSHPTSVVCTGGYFFVNSDGTGLVYASDINNGLSWNALNKATAETKSDNVIKLAVSREELWMIGPESAEIWYNAGNPTGFPFSLRVGLALNTGNLAPFSTLNVNDNLVWLDSRAYISETGPSALVRATNSGYQLNIIATEAITHAIKSYGTISDAIGCVYNDRGHIMLQWSFPTEKVTWVYNSTTQLWHQQAYYNEFLEEQEHSIFQFVSEINNVKIASGLRDGNIYVLSENYYDDNGVLIRRNKILPYLYQPTDLKYVTLQQLFIKVGIIDIPIVGDYTSAMLGIKYSKDNGHNWSATLWRELSTGEYGSFFSWNLGITSRSLLIEVSMSSPVALTLVNAWANTEVET